MATTANDSTYAYTRSQLIAIAHKYAVQIARRSGAVCAPQVMKLMAEKGMLEGSPHDPRWIGAVFGKRQGWRRTGRFRYIGSHARPAAEWTLSEVA